METAIQNPEITIQLFGVFRDLEPKGHLKLQTTFPIATADLKNLLLEYWIVNPVTKVDVKALLESSVLATDERVLDAGDLIMATDRLALLPPVCGG